MERVSSKNYVELAVSTESIDFDAIRARLADKRLVRLLHAAMGMATEAGELVDHLKKVIFYGAPLDPVNVVEEIGDEYWYCGLGLDEMGVSMDEALSKNIRKLASRYPKKFEKFAALVRDLESERKELER